MAHVLAELLKDVARENVPAPTQGMNPEKQVPSIDHEISSDELNTPPETKHPAETFTPNQPIVDQLTQDLAKSTRRNEEYTKLIVEL